MRKYDDFLAEQLQDEEFKKEYENLQPEFDVIRVIVDAIVRGWEVVETLVRSIIQ